MTKILNNKGSVKFENKENEDAALLKIYDDILKSKRGYVVKMPKKCESVVVCLSGGQDSVANTGILLKEFGLNVYPFFINRGQSNYKYEKRSVNYFDKDVFIKWSYKNGVPLHKARTCVKSFDIECGDCPTCWDRRRGYKEAGVKDLTKYRFPMSEKYPTYYDHEKEEKYEKRNRSKN